MKRIGVVDVKDLAPAVSAYEPPDHLTTAVMPPAMVAFPEPHAALKGVADETRTLVWPSLSSTRTFWLGTVP